MLTHKFFHLVLTLYSTKDQLDLGLLHLDLPSRSTPGQVLYLLFIIYPTISLHKTINVYVVTQDKHNSFEYVFSCHQILSMSSLIYFPISFLLLHLTLILPSFPLTLLILLVSLLTFSSLFPSTLYFYARNQLKCNRKLNT